MIQRVITFHYSLTDKAGKVIDSSKARGPMSYMEGSGQIIPGLERQMKELKKGDKKTLQVVAADAYGVRDEKRVVKVERQQLPEGVKVGDRLRGGEGDHAPIFTVMQVAEKEATLDANHALAGQDLTFEVELTDVREATAEEISHGHAHGEHGHSH